MDLSGGTDVGTLFDDVAVRLRRFPQLTFLTTSRPARRAGAASFSAWHSEDGVVAGIMVAARPSCPARRALSRGCGAGRTGCPDVDIALEQG